MTAPHQNLLGTTGAAAEEETDPNFNQTVLLVHADGSNGGQNNTFVDSSSSGHSITRNGNPTQGTFNPFLGDGYYSVYADTGETSYLAYTASSDFAFATGDFTVEFFVNLGIISTGLQDFFGTYTSAGSGTGWAVQMNGDNLEFAVANGAFTQYDWSSREVRVWYHVAITRESSVVRYFIDGTEVMEQTTGGDDNITNAGNLHIGNMGGLTNRHTERDFLSNIRIIKGTALYNASFTKPSSPLTLTSQGATSSEVKLLACGNNKFTELSSSARTPAVTGTPKVIPFSPFAPTASYSESVHGGSMAYNVTDSIHDQYLTITDDGSFNPGSGEFEISLWVYPTSFVASPGGPNYFSRGDLTDTGSPFISIQGKHGTGNSSEVDFYGGGDLVTSSNNIFLHQWNYIRARKTSSQKSLFINGVETTGANVTGVGAGASPFVGIGAQTYEPTNDGRQSHGYLCNIRYVVGSVGTESGIPNAPLTSTGTDTELLLNFTNAEIIDSTMKNNLETVGDAQIDTSIKKFGTGSVELDGTDDTVVSPAYHSTLFDIGNGAFTIEFFVYRRGTGQQTLIMLGTGDGNTVGLNFFWSSVLQIYNGASPQAVAIDADVGSLAQNQWVYVVLQRDASNISVYVDGTRTDNFANSTTWSALNRVSLGKHLNGTNELNGLLDEVRITRGIARYSGTSMTVPTKAHPNR
tara:strand:- start:79 stop:2154 length:2076 start_codon:yes stop_codon:yes gene_type:complete